jgi:hypothetical protein
MKLSVHLIAKRRCYRAGEEIPDDVEVSAFAKKFRIDENGNGNEEVDLPAAAAAAYPPVRRKRYVRRGSAWKHKQVEG